MSKVERMQSVLTPESNQESELNEFTSLREKIPVEDDNGRAERPPASLRRPFMSSHPSPRATPQRPSSPSPPPSATPRSPFRRPLQVTARTSSPPSRLHLLPLSASRRSQSPKTMTSSPLSSGGRGRCQPPDNTASPSRTPKDSASHHHQLTPKPSPEGGAGHQLALEQLAFAPLGWPRAPLVHSPPSPTPPPVPPPPLTDSNSSNTSSSATRRTYFQRRFSSRQVPFFVPLYGYPDALPCSRSLHPDQPTLLQLRCNPQFLHRDHVLCAHPKETKRVSWELPSQTAAIVCKPPCSNFPESPRGALRTPPPQAQSRPSEFSRDTETPKPVTKLVPIEEKPEKQMEDAEENNYETGTSEQLETAVAVNASIDPSANKVQHVSTQDTSNVEIETQHVSEATATKQGNTKEDTPSSISDSERRAVARISFQTHADGRPRLVASKKYTHDQNRTSQRMQMLKLKSMHRPTTLPRLIETANENTTVLPTRRFDRSKSERSSRRSLSSTQSNARQRSPLRTRAIHSSSSDEGIAERSMVQRSSLNMVPDLLPVPSSRVDEFSSGYNMAYDTDAADASLSVKTMFQRRSGSSASSLSSTESFSSVRRLRKDTLDSEILLWRKSGHSSKQQLQQGKGPPPQPRSNDSPASQGNSFTTFRIKLLRHGGTNEADERVDARPVHPVPHRRRRAEVVPYENRYRHRHRKSIRQDMWRRSLKAHGSDRGSLHDLASLPEEGSIHSESEETTERHDSDKQEPRRTDSPIRVRMRVKEGISVRVKGHESTLVAKNPLTHEDIQDEGKWATTLAWSQKLNLSKDGPNDHDNTVGSTFDSQDAPYKKSDRVKLMHGVQNVSIEDYDVPLKRVSSSTDIDVSISIREKGLSQDKDSSGCARELPLTHDPDAHEVRERPSKHQRKIKSIPNLTHDEAANEASEEQLLSPKRRQSKYRSRGTMQRKISLEQQSVETSSHGDTVSPFAYSDQESFRSTFRIQTKKSLPEMTVSEDSKRNGPRVQEDIMKQSLKPGTEISSLLFYRNGVPTFFHISNIPPTRKSCPSLPSDQTHHAPTSGSDDTGSNAANNGERRTQFRTEEEQVESGRGLEGHHPPCSSSPLMLEDIRMSLSDRFPSFVSSAAFEGDDVDCSTCPPPRGFLNEGCEVDAHNVCCSDEPQCKEPNVQEEFEEREIAVHEFLDETRSSQPLQPQPSPPRAFTPPRSRTPPPFLVRQSRSPTPTPSPTPSPTTSAATEKRPATRASPSPPKVGPVSQQSLGRGRVRRPTRKEERRLAEGIVIRDSPAPAAFGAAVRGARPRSRKTSEELAPSVQIEIQSTGTQRGSSSTRGGSSSTSPSILATEKARRAKETAKQQQQQQQQQKQPTAVTAKVTDKPRPKDRSAVEARKPPETAIAKEETQKPALAAGYKGQISKRDQLRSPSAQRRHELKITVNTVVQRSPLKLTRRSPKASEASSKDTSFPESSRERSSSPSSQRRPQSRSKTPTAKPSSDASSKAKGKSPFRKPPSTSPPPFVCPGAPRPPSSSSPPRSPPEDSSHRSRLSSLARGDIASSAGAADKSETTSEGIPTTLEQSMESCRRSPASHERAWVAKQRGERPVVAIHTSPASDAARVASKERAPAAGERRKAKTERASPVRSSASSQQKPTPKVTVISSSSSKSKLNRSPSRQRSRSKSSRHSILKGSSLQYELAPIQEHSAVSVARPPSSTVSSCRKWWQGFGQEGRDVRVLWSTTPDKWLNPRPSPENPFVPKDENAGAAGAHRSATASSESSRNPSKRERNVVQGSGEAPGAKTGTIRSAPVYSRDGQASVSGGNAEAAEKPYEEDASPSSHGRRPSAVLSHPSRTPEDQSAARSASETQPTLATQSHSKDIEYFASERVLRETWFTDVPRSSSLKKTTPSGSMADPLRRPSMEFRLAQVSPKSSRAEQQNDHNAHANDHNNNKNNNNKPLATHSLHKATLRKKRVNHEGRKSRLLGGIIATTSAFTASGSDVSRTTEQLCAIRNQRRKPEEGEEFREDDGREDRAMRDERMRREEDKMEDEEEGEGRAVKLLWSRSDERKPSHKKGSPHRVVEAEHSRASRGQDRRQLVTSKCYRVQDARPPPWMAGTWSEEARAWARAAVCRERFIQSARSWWPGGGAPLTCPWCYSTQQPIEDSGSASSTCPIAAICTAGCLPLLRMLFGGGESPVRLRCGHCRRFLGSWDEQRSRLRPVRLPPLPPPPPLPPQLALPAPPPHPPPQQPPPPSHHRHRTGARPRTTTRMAEASSAFTEVERRRKEATRGWEDGGRRRQQQQQHHPEPQREEEDEEGEGEEAGEEEDEEEEEYRGSHSRRTHGRHEYASASPHRIQMEHEPRTECLASWQKPWPIPQEHSMDAPQLLIPFRIPPPPAPPVSPLRSQHISASHPPMSKW